MGNCCGGSQYGSSDADGEAWPSDRRLSKRGPSKEKMLQEGAKRMSDDAQERAQALFKQYRQRASMINVNQDLTEPSLPASPAVSSQRSEGGTARGRMTERELKMLLHDVEPELFQFVWGLFDTKGDGFVYADDFVAGMALLSTSANEDASFEEQIGACFIMFDTRGDGKLGCAHRAHTARACASATGVASSTPAYAAARGESQPAPASMPLPLCPCLSCSRLFCAPFTGTRSFAACSRPR